MYLKYISKRNYVSEINDSLDLYIYVIYFAQFCESQVPIYPPKIRHTNILVGMVGYLIQTLGYCPGFRKINSIWSIDKIKLRSTCQIFEKYWYIKIHQYQWYMRFLLELRKINSWFYLNRYYYTWILIQINTTFQFIT